MSHADPAVVELALAQHGVVTMDQLRALRVTDGRRRAQEAAERWHTVPYRAVVIPGFLDEHTGWWRALAEVGRPAALGGITALQAAGLEGFEEPRIHVWLPKSSRVVRPSGVRVHETRRWNRDDWMGAGIPRSRPSVATVQAALWAGSRRQAVLALVMPIQQRLVRVDDVAPVLDRVKRHRHRSVLRATFTDIADGAHSLNELDFAALCRQYGLPEPSRQIVRQGAKGRIYLDVRWDRYRVVVEINGAGHLRLDRVMNDDFRIIDIQLRGEFAIELSVLTLRAEPEEAMARIAAVLRSRGCPVDVRPSPNRPASR